MPLIDHSGGSETSQDIGEKYRQLVEDYFREQGYIIERRSTHHATTEDIAAVTVSDDYELISGGKEVPNREYFKEVRVEAKAGELSRLDSTFIDEILRVFIDYQKLGERDQWFEYHIFTPHLQAKDKWENIFDRQQYDDEAVKTYYEETKERNDLNDDEKELFSEYGFAEFKKFLTDVFVHEADERRLRHLIKNEKEIDRSKWDFYTREYTPYPQKETLLPNFLQITDFPEYIWIADCHVDHYSDIFDENPRHLPVYYEKGQLYSLLPESKMKPSLVQFIDPDSLTQREFLRWKQDVSLSVLKNLLNRAIKRRGVMNYDACRIVRHNADDLLLFRHEDVLANNRNEPDQIELSQLSSKNNEKLTGSSKTEESQGSNSPASKEVGGWKVTMEWGDAFAHRYCLPQVKRYEETYYVIVETGWVFSENGLGNTIVEGDRAHELHTRLQSSQYHNPNNEKAQFRQWRAYLDLERPDNQQQRIGEQNPQNIAFSPVEGLSLDERPPKDTTEENNIKEKIDPYL